MADNTAGQTLTKTADFGNGFSEGKIVLDATALVAADDLPVNVGFRPRYIRFRNSSGVMIEWFEGMAANSCFKTAATGAQTLETANGGITVDDRGFRVRQNATLAAVTASSTLYYAAHA
jgi:hypothetical protein